MKRFIGKFTVIMFCFLLAFTSFNGVALGKGKDELPPAGSNLSGNGNSFKMEDAERLYSEIMTLMEDKVSKSEAELTKQYLIDTLNQTVSSAVYSIENQQSVSFYNVLDYGIKGDGVTDETNALIELIAQVKEHGGGDIYFPAGKYLISQTIFVPSGLTLQGVNGRSEIIFQSSAIQEYTETNKYGTSIKGYLQGYGSAFMTGPRQGERYGYPNSDRGSNIAFKNLIINGSSNEVDAASFGALTFHHGIRTFQTDFLTIEGVEIKNFLHSGIYLNTTKHTLIRNNHIHDVGFLTVAASKNGISLNDTQMAIVENNLIHHIGNEGIQYGFSNDIIITKNVISHTEDMGIEGDTAYQTTDPVDPPGDVIITDNLISDAKTQGITVGNSNSQKAVVANNVIQRAGQYGIIVGQHSKGEVIIASNIVRQVGFNLGNTAYHAIVADTDEVTISGNQIYDVGTGAGISLPKFRNAVITGNKIERTAGVSISVSTFNQKENANSLLINNNNCSYSAGRGIAIDNPNVDFIFNSVQLSNNTISNVDYFTNGTGIGISFGKRVKIKSVVVSGNQVLSDDPQKLGNSLLIESTASSQISKMIVSGNDLSHGKWAGMDGHEKVGKLVNANNLLNSAGGNTDLGTAKPYKPVTGWAYWDTSLSSGQVYDGQAYAPFGIQLVDKLPAPSESYRGVTKILRGAETDTMYICLKINGVYKWVQLNN